MTTVSTTADTRAAASSATRWTQLIVAIVCMILIANLQYGWTLFVNPMNQAHGWSIKAIQLAFSIFVALETWLTPIWGWIADNMGTRTGPKLMIAMGGILVALGWRCSISARCSPAPAAVLFTRPAWGRR
jgi:MFS transporter, OFA family, oxalate/formate antiporter